MKSRFKLIALLLCFPLISGCALIADSIQSETQATPDKSENIAYLPGSETPEITKENYPTPPPPSNFWLREDTLEDNGTYQQPPDPSLFRLREIRSPDEEECLIKGNISLRSGERIYHVPGQEYYEETIIREEYGERWFCSEEEAQAAGWRKSKR